MTGRLIICISVFCSLLQLSLSTFAQEFSFYLIGDAGEDTLQGPALQLLDSLLQQENENSGVIFLGDNVYDKGLEFSHSAKRRTSEQKLLTQLHTADNFKGQFFMIPGNHDWRASKWKGLQQIREEEFFVKKYFAAPSTTIQNPASCFIPPFGFPGPTSIVLDSLLRLRLIAYDPQWWLQQQFFHKVSRKPGMSAKEMKEKFFEELRTSLSEAEKNQETVIIAGHHPLMTIGTHARLSQPLHFFTTYIPPLQIFRLMGLNRLFRQDMQSNAYRKLADSMLSIIQQHKQLIYVNGHDHNLQYFADEKRNMFITSGAGSKTEPFDPKATSKPAWKNDTDTGFFKLIFDAGGLKSIAVYTPISKQEIRVEQ